MRYLPALLGLLGLVLASAGLALWTGEPGVGMLLGGLGLAGAGFLLLPADGSGESR